MPTIKITGVDERFARFVERRYKDLHFKSQAEYIRSLIRADMVQHDAQQVAEITAQLTERLRRRRR